MAFSISQDQLINFAFYIYQLISPEGGEREDSERETETEIETETETET